MRMSCAGRQRPSRPRQARPGEVPDWSRRCCSSCVTRASVWALAPTTAHLGRRQGLHGLAGRRLHISGMSIWAGVCRGSGHKGGRHTPPGQRLSWPRCRAGIGLGRARRPALALALPHLAIPQRLGGWRLLGRHLGQQSGLGRAAQAKAKAVVARAAGLGLAPKSAQAWPRAFSSTGFCPCAA